MSNVNRKKLYFIYIDILGFIELPNELSRKTQLEPNYIRDNLIYNPVLQELNNLTKDEEFYKFTDNFLIFTTSQDKVFQIIRSICSLKLPILEPMYIPYEIAIGRTYKDTSYPTITQNNIVQKLQENIISKYKKYRAVQKMDSIKETFILLTNDFYEDLDSNRRLYCKEIETEPNRFFQADINMTMDISGQYISDDKMSEKFSNNIKVHNIWKYIEIKVVIYRDSNGNWILLFLYSVLLETEPPKIKEIITNDCQILHEVYQIDILQEIMDSLFNTKNFSINGITPDLSHFRSPESDFGGYQYDSMITPPVCYYGLIRPAIYLKKNSEKFILDKSLEEKISSQIAGSYPQFDKSHSRALIEAIKSYNIRFWNYDYLPFIGLFALFDMEYPKITVQEDRIDILIRMSKRLKPKDFRIDFLLEKHVISKRLRMASKDQNSFTTSIDLKNLTLLLVN